MVEEVIFDVSDLSNLIEPHSIVEITSSTNFQIKLTEGKMNKLFLNQQCLVEKTDITNKNTVRSRRKLDRANNCKKNESDSSKIQEQLLESNNLDNVKNSVPLTTTKPALSLSMSPAKITIETETSLAKIRTIQDELNSNNNINNTGNDNLYTRKPMHPSSPSSRANTRSSATKEVTTTASLHGSADDIPLVSKKEKIIPKRKLQITTPHKDNVQLRSTKSKNLANKRLKTCESVTTAPSTDTTSKKGSGSDSYSTAQLSKGIENSSEDGNNVGSNDENNRNVLIKSETISTQRTKSQRLCKSVFRKKPVLPKAKPKAKFLSPIRSESEVEDSAPSPMRTEKKVQDSPSNSSRNSPKKKCNSTLPEDLSRDESSKIIMPKAKSTVSTEGEDEDSPPSPIRTEKKVGDSLPSSPRHLSTKKKCKPALPKKKVEDSSQKILPVTSKHIISIAKSKYSRTKVDASPPRTKEILSNHSSSETKSTSSSEVESSPQKKSKLSPKKMSTSSSQIESSPQMKSKLSPKLLSPVSERKTKLASLETIQSKDLSSEMIEGVSPETLTKAPTPLVIHNRNQSVSKQDANTESSSIERKLPTSNKRKVLKRTKVPSRKVLKRTKVSSRKVLKRTKVPSRKVSHCDRDVVTSDEYQSELLNTELDVLKKINLPSTKVSDSKPDVVKSDEYHPEMLNTNEQIALVFASLGLDFQQCIQDIECENFESLYHQAGPGSSIVLCTAKQNSTLNPSLYILKKL